MVHVMRLSASWRHKYHFWAVKTAGERLHCNPKALRWYDPSMPQQNPKWDSHSEGQVLLVAFATKRSIIWLLAFGQVSVRLYISGKDGTSFGRDSHGSFCVVNICACGWILLGLSKVPVLSTTKPLGATWYSHQTNVPHLEQKWGSYPAPLPVGKVVDFVSPFILNPDLVVRVWITKALPV